jgi:uncharacterized membrane protein
VAQFAPALLGGLYWRGASRQGVYAGLSAGFAIWVYTLLLPTLTRAGWLGSEWLFAGPLGLGWLRPEQLFGLTGWDAITHGTFWSLLFNVGAFMVVSARYRPSFEDRIRATPFLDPYASRPIADDGWRGNVRTADLLALASRFLGERVTPLQWGGLLLGLGGVGLILYGRPMSGDAGFGWLASGVSLVSITLGTLYQKRFCGGIDWRAGNTIQYLAALALYTGGAFAFETRTVAWTAPFVGAVVWLALVLSIGSIGLLYWLIRRSAATQVASLFYLVPATTALMAFVLFGETLTWLAILGMVVCAAAVLLVNRKPVEAPAAAA